MTAPIACVRNQAVNKMTAEPVGPASQPTQQQAFMQALTTEHFTLQTARAVAVNEGNGRTALYIGALSSTLVAWPWSPSSRGSACSPPMWPTRSTGSPA